MDAIKSTCRTCGKMLLNLEVCYECSGRANELRDHYDAVYLAAMGGCCADTNVGSPDRDVLALESVRTHAARMAELEAVIAEVVENG